MLLATREFAAANRQWRQQLVTRSADEVCAAWVAIRRHCQQLLPVPGPFAYFSVMKSMWQNYNKKNIQQQVKGKFCLKIHDWCLFTSPCHHKKCPSTFHIEPQRAIITFCFSSSYIGAWSRNNTLSKRVLHQVALPGNRALLRIPRPTNRHV